MAHAPAKTEFSREDPLLLFSTHSPPFEITSGLSVALLLPVSCITCTNAIAIGKWNVQFVNKGASHTSKYAQGQTVVSMAPESGAHEFPVDCLRPLVPEIDICAFGVWRRTKSGA